MKREYSWTTKAGLRAVVVNLGHRCGYVAVPKGHKLWGKDYREQIPRIRIDVHGGMTYSSYSPGEIYPEPSADSWWFGFDCRHSNDNPSIGGQSLSYCIEECERMAEQLEAV